MYKWLYIQKSVALLCINNKKAEREIKGNTHLYEKMKKKNLRINLFKEAKENCKKLIK